MSAARPPSPPRTLLVAQRLGPGGMSRYLVEHAVALREIGCPATILTPQSEPARPLLEGALRAGVGVRLVPALSRTEARRAIGDFEPALVRLCSGKGPPDTRLFGPLHGPGRALLESVHLPSSRPRARVLQALAYRVRPKRRYRLLAFSAGMAAWLRSAAPALASVVRELPYGLRLPGPALGVRPPRREGEPLRLLVLARLDERQKDTACLLHALAGEPALQAEVRLAIVGDGPDRAALEALARSLRLGDVVTFEGWTPDPLARLRDADVLVNSTRIESFGRINVEAASVGTPVIASRVMGCEESVGEGQSGLLVPPGDAGALARAIAHLLDHPDEHARFSAQGPGWARRFDVHAHARAVLGVWQEAIHE